MTFFFPRTSDTCDRKQSLVFSETSYSISLFVRLFDYRYFLLRYFIFFNKISLIYFIHLFEYFLKVLQSKKLQMWKETLILYPVFNNSSKS